VKKTKVAIASDHAGYFLKEKIIKYLKADNEIKDLGSYQYEETDDYPDLPISLQRLFQTVKLTLEFQFAEQANGMNIAVNKQRGIRSALCWNEISAVLPGP